MHACMHAEALNENRKATELKMTLFKLMLNLDCNEQRHLFSYAEYNVLVVLGARS